MDVLHFWKKYELIASTKKYKASTSGIRVCRFCNKNETETTFISQPHVLPELLGENNFISQDECDRCNNLFSSFESHLAIFLRPYLTMFDIKGKRKVPEFHSRTNNRDENTRTIIKSLSEKQRHIYVGDLQDYKIDDIKKVMSITFRKQPHRPIYIYKSLVKIGLSLLPAEKVPQYKIAFDWIAGNDSPVHYFVSAFTTILTYRKFGAPFADLYYAKRTLFAKTFLPELTLVIGFGNLVMQIFLPLSDVFDYAKAEGKKPVLNLYPAFAIDDINKKERFAVSCTDLKGNDPITYDQTLNFTYQQADLNIHASNHANDI